MAELGVELPDWTPPPWPGPMRLDGRYARVEPLVPGHAKELFEAYRVDDGTWTYLPYGPFPNEAAYAAWVVQMAGKADPLFFAVIDRERKQAAGDASRKRLAPEARGCEVGNIAWSPAERGSRAAGLASVQEADWVFREGYRRFEWKCDALNRPSRRAAERMGFSFEGIFRQAVVVKGRNRDTAWFAMTDGDWRCLKPAWEAWLDPANFDAGGGQKLSLRDLTASCRVASDPLFAP
jgi:RimJ/RimL family protein N-acetyltransferase